MKRYTRSLVLVIIVLLASCGGAAVSPEMPPEIRYGEDICDHCGMIINDERFAAGVVVQTQPQHYEHRIFDDIGDMLAYAHEIEAPLEIVAYYVHDYQSREWLDARQATYVQGDAMSTPMGSGLAAFADHTAAVAHARATQGHVLDFETVHNQAPQQHGHAVRH